MQTSSCRVAMIWFRSTLRSQYHMWITGRGEAAGATDRCHAIYVWFWFVTTAAAAAAAEMAVASQTVCGPWRLTGFTRGTTAHRLVIRNVSAVLTSRDVVLMTRRHVTSHGERRARLFLQPFSATIAAMIAAVTTPCTRDLKSLHWLCKFEPHTSYILIFLTLSTTCRASCSGSYTTYKTEVFFVHVNYSQVKIGFSEQVTHCSTRRREVDASIGRCHHSRPVFRC